MKRDRLNRKLLSQQRNKDVVALQRIRFLNDSEICNDGIRRRKIKSDLDCKINNNLAAKLELNLMPNLTLSSNLAVAGNQTAEKSICDEPTRHGHEMSENQEDIVNGDDMGNNLISESSDINEGSHTTQLLDPSSKLTDHMILKRQSANRRKKQHQMKVLQIMRTRYVICIMTLYGRTMVCIWGFYL